MLREVGVYRIQQAGIVFHGPRDQIASVAEQPAHHPCAVIMVDRQPARPAAAAQNAFRLAADCAQAVLLRQHRVVVGGRELISVP